MRYTARLILLAIVGWLLPGLSWCAQPTADRVTNEYDKLAKKYSIEILLAAPPLPEDGWMTARAATRKNLEIYLPMFSSEWNIYPPELVERSKLRRIILCEDVRVHGVLRGGAASGAGEGDELWLDVGPLPWKKFYTRAIIHHEFFHVMDRRMHINIGDRFGLSDAKWESLNPAGFKYDMAIQSDPLSPALDQKLKGFLSKYAKSAVEEDKAVLFSFMITQGQVVDARAKTDPVLQSKVLRIKELVKELSPKTDDGLWEAARKVTRLGS